MRTAFMPPCMSAISTGAPQVMLRSGSNCSGFVKLPYWIGVWKYPGMPLAPAWNHILPWLSMVTPHCPPFDPVDSRSTPPGVHFSRTGLMVL